MQKALAPLLAVVLVAAGIALQQDPYRLRDPGHAADQLVLAHRDSTYTHISWVTSDAQNYAQLRFYDRVEGGACLHPTWAELAGLSPETLGHLARPETIDGGGQPARSWPDGRPTPDMGTLTNTKYISLYPLAVLLNQRLMDAAGGDPRKAAPNVLIVGLGSGVGIGMLAHHFPEASITCVDIDREVIDMVREHYPLMRWLERDAPPTAAGHKRMTFIARDARQAVIYPELRDDQRPYDVVVLDAYTAGSTIPPHLMTREFYAEIRGAMTEDGICLSNIIGSYTGPQKLLLGGAMRSMRAAGLEHVHNFPIVYPEFGSVEPGFDDAAQAQTRNNIVLCSTAPLDPKGNRAGWAAIDRFVAGAEPYADLPAKRFRSVYAMLHDNEGVSMAASLLDADGQALDARLLDQLIDGYGNQPWDQRYGYLLDDQKLIEAAATAVRGAATEAGADIPRGWDMERPTRLRVVFVDWVVHARHTFANSVDIAREPASLTRFLHSGRHLVGPMEDEREDAEGDWVIGDAPLFTDGKPNADIYNH